jgi:hypothetical protein
MPATPLRQLDEVILGARDDAFEPGLLERILLAAIEGGEHDAGERERARAASGAARSNTR